MGIFKSRKKNDVIDLTGRYKEQLEKQNQMRTMNLNQQPSQIAGSQEASAFNFLDSSSSSNVSGNLEDKRKKVVKRLLDMTNKIEELSNQIYRLQQRIEVLERKAGVRTFE